MSGIDCGVGWQCVDYFVFQGFNECWFTAAWKVAPADFAPEQAVAAEQYAGFGAIKAYTAGSVSRCGNDTKRVCAEGDDIAFGKCCSWFRQ